MHYSIVHRSNFIFGIPHFFSAVQRREKNRPFVPFMPDSHFLKDTLINIYLFHRGMVIWKFCCGELLGLSEIFKAGQKLATPGQCTAPILHQSVLMQLIEHRAAVADGGFRPVGGQRRGGLIGCARLVSDRWAGFHSDTTFIIRFRRSYSHSKILAIHVLLSRKHCKQYLLCTTITPWKGYPPSRKFSCWFFLY